jgi:hypothetical protein
MEIVFNKEECVDGKDDWNACNCFFWWTAGGDVFISLLIR